MFAIFVSVRPTYVMPSCNLVGLLVVLKYKQIRKTAFAANVT